jgi:hypothetical protein
LGPTAQSGLIVRKRWAKSQAAALRDELSFRAQEIFVKTFATIVLSLAAAAALAGAAVADPVDATKDAARGIGHGVAQTGRATGHAVADVGRAGGHAVASTGRDIGHGVHHVFHHRRRRYHHED